MTVLMPRLASVHALQRMSGFVGRELQEIAGDADAQLATLPTTFASIGGTRVESGQLVALRDEIRGFARKAGYPNKAGRDGQQQFDREAALVLRGFSGFDAGEAIRAETWQFVAAGLLPDIVFWRFPPDVGGATVTEARYLGGNRNCFGRLWQRAAVLWDDRLAKPAELLALLKEDNFVAILERSSFAAQPRPCCEVARAFLLRRQLVHGAGIGSPDQTLLRDAMCRVIRMTGYGALWALDDIDLCAQVARILDAALGAFGVAPVATDELVRRQPQLELVRGSSRAS